MAKSFQLSSIGGLAIAGAGLGLYLGSSAISEINPAYYSTPFSSARFHSDLVPNPGDRDSAQPLPELAAVSADLGPSCVSCGLAADEYAAVSYPPADSYGSYGALPAEAIVAEADEYVSQGLSLRDARDIERYASFRISEEDEEPGVAARADRGAGDCAASDRCDKEAAPAI